MLHAASSTFDVFAGFHLPLLPTGKLDIGSDTLIEVGAYERLGSIIFMIHVGMLECFRNRQMRIEKV